MLEPKTKKGMLVTWIEYENIQHLPMLEFYPDGSVYHLLKHTPEQRYFSAF